MTMQKQMGLAEWGMMLVLSLLWGGSFLFNGILVKALPPFTIVTGRVLLAAIALNLIVRMMGHAMPRDGKSWVAFFGMGVLNNMIPFCLIVWGQTHIASGLASILNATTPIWGVLVAHFFTQDERMTPRKIAGVVLGFGGVAVMIGPMLLANVGTDALAQLACISASLSYAFAAVWARRFRRMGISPMSVTTGQLSAGALLMLPLALLVDQPWTQPFPPLTAWGAIVALAVMCTAFGYVLYFRLIESAGATNALLVTLLVPPFAILFGSLFLNEVLAPQDFIGLALIALGLAAIDGRLLRRLRLYRAVTSAH